ncbi:hypothetical protein CRV24_005104 [Beauveria bassiana]|nr:hypothetical protein CRV24_005104 [Beauveria bassiana]KAH8711748.1 hypothetical protein HC256_008562 [Beauveria bassiana]
MRDNQRIQMDEISERSPLRRAPDRTRIGYAAQRLSTVAGQMTKHLLLYTCLLLYPLTLLSTASAQVNFTPGTWPISLQHNCLGELMSTFTDENPAYFANRAINHVRQLPYEFGGDEGFATFVSKIPADKMVLVDLTEEDRPECNHVELHHVYSPYTTWMQRARYRYTMRICRVRTRAMPLRDFLVDKDLRDVEFH